MRHISEEMRVLLNAFDEAAQQEGVQVEYTDQNFRHVRAKYSLAKFELELAITKLEGALEIANHRLANGDGGGK